MKRVLKVLSIVISFLIGSNVVLATNARFMSGGTHVLADQYKMQLLIENPGSSGNFTIVYDTDAFTYVSNSVSGSSNQYNITASGNQVSIDMTYAGGSSSDLINLWFNEKKSTPFTTTFTINATANNQTNSSTVDVSFRYPNSNANLSALTVKEGTTALTLSPSFSPDVTSYNLTTYASSIKVSATKEDSKASVSGTGTKSLSVGSNTITVTVTAENGTPKDYVIHVTRLEKSSDTSLKELSVNGNKFTISSGKDSYSTTIDTQSATVSAKALDSKASVSYPNGQSVSLNPGESKNITVKVTAENGSSKNYTVTINRKNNNTTSNTNTNTDTNNNTNNANNNSTNTNKPSTSNSNTNNQKPTTNTSTNTNTTGTTKPTTTDPSKDSNNYIKSLQITNIDFTFNKKTLDYVFNVENDLDMIDFDIVLESNKASYQLIGDNNLSIGKNEFRIEVTAENGSKRTYMITVNRRENVIDAANNEQSILDAINNAGDSDEIYIDIEDLNEKVTLTPNILKSLKDNNMKLVVSYFEGNVLEYQLHINPKDIDGTDEVKLGIISDFISDATKKDLKYKNYYSYKIDVSGTSLRGVILDIYVLNKVDDLNRFDLLSINNNETTTLIDDKIIEDGYLSYNFVNFDEGIIIANPDYKNVTTIKNNNKKNYTPYIIVAGALVAANAVAITYFIKKKKSKTVSVETPSIDNTPTE